MLIEIKDNVFEKQKYSSTQYYVHSEIEFLYKTTHHLNKKN